MKINFILKKRVIIHLPVKKDEFMSQLHQFVLEKPLNKNNWYKNMFNRKKYIGEIYDNLFIIEPTSHSSMPYLRIYGNIENENENTVAKLKFTITNQTLMVLIAFSCVFPIGLLVFGFFYYVDNFLGGYNPVSLHNPLIIIPIVTFLFPLIFYIIVVVTFNVEIKLFINRFKEYFG